MEAPTPALTAKVAVVEPPAGGVTGVGKVNATLLGAVPTQDPDNVTEELKPPNEATIIGAVAIEPGARMIAVVDVAEKSCALPAITSKVSVAEWPRGPLDPVIVSGYVPTATLPGTNTVNVDDTVPPAVGVTGLALKLPEIPDAPENERVTGEAKLLDELTSTLTVPVEP